MSRTEATVSKTWVEAKIAECDSLRARVAELEAENAVLGMQHEADAAAIGQMARKALKH